jgi:hypothetical protein
MGRSSTADEKAKFLKMVVSKTDSFYLLKIWDGRYAAFWYAGFDAEHCSAVAAHEIWETGWPFAFVHKDKKVVLAYIAESERAQIDSSKVSYD